MSKSENGVSILIVKLLTIAILSCFFICVNRQIDIREREEIKAIDDSWKYAYQIDAVYTEKNELILDGWFFRLEKYNNIVQEFDHDKEFGILLEELDPETGNIIYDDGSIMGNATSSGIKKEEGLMSFFGDLFRNSRKKIHGIIARIEPVLREDVGDYFTCEYDYSSSGFSAHFRLRDIDLENGLYRVVFKTDIAKRDSIQANAYIYKGQLSYTNPVTIQELDVVDTDLEDIVRNGVCLASCMDYHFSLYQYGWKLYFIADEYFDFRENSTYIQYQLCTTQFDRLPEYRTIHGWYDANIGASFEEYEITDTMNSGKYRVCVRDIPNGYSVSAFKIGFYENDKWLWQVNPIRPYYDFSTIPDVITFGYLGDDVADWVKQ